jgi:hypothetical protein
MNHFEFLLLVFELLLQCRLLFDETFFLFLDCLRLPFVGILCECCIEFIFCGKCFLRRLNLSFQAPVLCATASPCRSR